MIVLVRIVSMLGWAGQLLTRCLQFLWRRRRRKPQNRFSDLFDLTYCGRSGVLLDASKLSIKRCAAPARKRQSLTPRDDGQQKKPRPHKPSGALKLGGGAQTQQGRGGVQAQRRARKPAQAHGGMGRANVASKIDSQAAAELEANGAEHDAPVLGARLTISRSASQLGPSPVLRAVPAVTQK